MFRTSLGGLQQLKPVAKIQLGDETRCSNAILSWQCLRLKVSSGNARYATISNETLGFNEQKKQDKPTNPNAIT